ncbi:hypothetical protein SUNI508_13334 [Seiridium unicorne]|uniref:Uncharacterized protein n=1 Tax=Seiridium unicorne TaxID=138068 RepID=A0ABR2VEN4_9PEZI
MYRLLPLIRASKQIWNDVWLSGAEPRPTPLLTAHSQLESQALPTEKPPLNPPGQASAGAFSQPKGAQAAANQQQLEVIKLQFLAASGQKTLGPAELRALRTSNSPASTTTSPASNRESDWPRPQRRHPSPLFPTDCPLRDDIH